MATVIEFILHIDTHLELLVQTYGPLVYFIMFIIIFAQTGLVFTPFLPGDSLIFAVAALAAAGSLNIVFLVVLLMAAAFLGNTSNYFIGRTFGSAISKSRFIKQKYMASTEEFFARFGGRAIIIARFMPIIRTFAPFVAGIGKMNFARFSAFNVVGCVLWVGLMSTLGYLFGNIPVVREHFSFVTIGIIIISILPAIFTYISERKKQRGKN